MFNALCQLSGFNIVCQTGVDSGVEQKFQQHTAQYGLQFATVEEYKMRLQLFAEVDLEFQQINQNPEHTFTVDHNMFSTMTQTERKRFLGRRSVHSNTNISTAEPTDLQVVGVDDTIDWRAKGAVNPVENQGQCGSCWAFSVTAVLEGAHFIAHGKLVKLAEQQIMDCDIDGDDDGCYGGVEISALKWLQTNRQQLRADYPYTAKEQACHQVVSKAVAQVKDVF